MKSSKLFAVAVIAVVNVAAARAAHVDMNDPRRALGREDDVRIDAQLVDETVSSGSPVGVTYQIQNFSTEPIAIADKVCDVSYDNETRVITVSVGLEVPTGGGMPRLNLIAPGQKRTFTCGAILHVVTSSARSVFTAVPQYVQIKVNVLRNVEPFQALIQQQAARTGSIELTDQQFDQWLESNDAILLNQIPVRYSTGKKAGMSDASQRQNNFQ